MHETILQNELNDLCFKCKYDIIMADGMKNDSDELFTQLFNETMEYYINKECFEMCINLMKFKR